MGTHVSSAAHGWVEEQLCVVHCPVPGSRQVPFSGGAAHRSEQNSLGCAQRRPGPQGSAVHSIAIVLKQAPVTGPRQPLRQPWKAAWQL
jgi:hypothetical protein